MSLRKRLLSLVSAAAMSFSLAAVTPGTAASAATADNSGFTAAEIAADMGMGWNLGNTLDATGLSGLNTETSWGNPVTTKAMIDAVKAKGFDTIRVPVTWYKHMDSSYTVDAAWMNRVHEVVDYCIDDGMYVILNSHHDEWNKPTNDNYSAASNELKILWTQIAESFKDYDKHLIFEGMNEPRYYSGGDLEWVGDAEARSVINKLNADFVSTVRATGGNNADRALMIPGYAASSSYANLAAIEIPDDDNIIVSVHAYLPYAFCMGNNASSLQSFDSSMQAQLDSFFSDLSNLFISKGIPVCIGEFSASNYSNTTERVKWAKYYAAAAKKLAIPCVLWDNNCDTNSSAPGEAHGYLDRDALSWYSASEPVVNALISTYVTTKTDLPEIVSVPDLSKATTTNVIDSTSYDAGQWWTDTTYTFNFSSMDDNGLIAVTYSGTAPTMLVLDSSWNTLSKVTPTIVDGGVAYYFKSTLEEKGVLSKGVRFLLTTDGNGDCTVKKVAYYVVPKTVTVKISDCDITVPATVTYTGSAATPDVTVKYGSTTLTKGTDYTLSYKNNTAPGTGTVTVTGAGSYTGSVSKTFSIVCTHNYTHTVVPATPDAQGYTEHVCTICGDSYKDSYTDYVETSKDISKATLTLAATTFTYTGTNKCPAVTVKYDGVTLKKNTDYTVKYENYVNAGTATVTITGKGDYTGTKTASYTIKRRNVTTTTMTLSKTSFTYSGKAIGPTLTVTYNGMTLKKGTDYVVAYTNNTEPGTATVTITGKGNYGGKLSADFTIKPSMTQCTVTLKKTTFNYSGNPIGPSLTVYYGDKLLTKGTDYTVKYTDNVEKGEGKVIITGKGSYGGSVTKTFTIK